jgi:hypothetical protein
MPSLTSGSVLNGVLCTFIYSGPLLLTPESRSRSPPRDKGRKKLLKRHPYWVQHPLGRISHKHYKSREKDWISLLKKRSLETNSFILKDAVGHTQDCFKSAEFRVTYAVFVSCQVDWELTEPPQFSSMARASSKGAQYR